MDRNENRSVASIGASRALLGPGLDAAEDVVIEVASGRITAISSGALIHEADVTFEKATLIPGFIDSHVHVGFHDWKDILAGGVTTVRDTGSPVGTIFPLAERSKEDRSIPLTLAAGPILTAPGGYPTRAAWAADGTGREVTSLDDARRAVAEIAALGACVIKVALNPPVGPTLDGSTLGAIVDTAHDRALRVTGHVHGLEQLGKALDAGMDELAHMLMSTEEIPDRTIDRMVSAGMAVVPTMSIRSGRDLKVAIGNLARFRAAGGRVIYGTDLGNEGPQPGIDAREVKAMERAGFDGRAIIASATVEAASYLGLDERGSLKEGNWADIVSVDRDPVAKPKRLTQVRGVLREGNLVTTL